MVNASRFSLLNGEMRYLLPHMPNILEPYASTESHEFLRCPYSLHESCPLDERYRTYDGRCNNLQRPLWGSAHQPLHRFLPADYADGRTYLRCTIGKSKGTRSTAFRNMPHRYTGTNMPYGITQCNLPPDRGDIPAQCPYPSRRWYSIYGPITIAIRARFEYDSSAIQHPTRSYVLSSNNEHVNSFALL